MNCLEIVKAIELGKTVLYTEKGFDNWKEMKKSKTGFALDFVRYDYKVKEN